MPGGSPGDPASQVGRARRGWGSEVRVTVISGGLRADLVLPGAVPVAELLPELARSVGVLDAGTAHGGHHLTAANGRRLATGIGLAQQGVEDGALLTVSARVNDPPPQVHDDVAQAMAEAVERDLRTLSPAAGRRTALAASTTLLVLGAAALILHRESAFGAAVAAVVAVLLLVGAVAANRTRSELEAALCLAWAGAGYAAAAGVMTFSDHALIDPVTVAAAGAGTFAAALAAVIGLGEGRVFLIPLIVVGGVLAAGGLVAEATGVELSGALTAALVGVVMSANLLPGLAVAGSRTRGVHLKSADPSAADQIGRAAQSGHDVLLVASASVGALIVLISPMAVSLGRAGALTAVACCVVVMLRTRRHRAGAEVLVGVGAGLVGLSATAGAVVALHPEQRPALAVLSAVAGAGLVTLTLAPDVGAVRRRQGGDVAEVVALAALPPLLLLAVGLVG